MNALPVTIIVPVYRAPDDTRACLQALHAHTPADASVVVIDDGSNSDALDEVLDEAALRAPAWIVRRRWENLGFVATVNEGLALRNGGNVVILNSDTRVTPGWLDGLRRAALALPNAASITPWSNAATICSLFGYCRERPMPDGWSDADVQALLHRLSPCVYPEIPTGVGFCMFMRDTVLDAIGGFDVVAFGHGYGEENDWCMRARAAGHRHYLADDVFVYHRGSASFAAPDKRERLANAERVLRARWPSYFGDVARWVDRAPTRAFIEMVAERLSAPPPRPQPTGKRLRVVHVLHADPRGASVPGTEYHVQQLSAGMRQQVESWFVWKGPDAYVGCHAERPLEVLQWGNAVAGEEEYLRAHVWNDLLTTLAPDVVHVHHSMRWGPSFLPLASARFPVVATMHDYYWLCSRHNLLHAETGRYCGLPTAPEVCERCMQQTDRDRRVSIPRWRRDYRQALEEVDAVVAPSQAARALLLEVYPSLQSKSLVLPHACERRPFDEPATTPPSMRGGLRVLVLGYHSAEKGTGLLRDLAMAMPETTFVSLGRVGDDDGPTPPKNLILDGAYLRAELPAKLALAHCHVALFLSLWPESFSYTLSEAWAAGLPAIVPDVGAPGERVRANGVGWTYRLGEFDDILATLRTVRDNEKDWRSKARAAAATDPSLSMEEFSARLMAVYRSATLRHQQRQLRTTVLSPHMNDATMNEAP